jgi:hypothetical protein
LGRTKGCRWLFQSLCHSQQFEIVATTACGHKHPQQCSAQACPTNWIAETVAMPPPLHQVNLTSSSPHHDQFPLVTPGEPLWTQGIWPHRCHPYISSDRSESGKKCTQGEACVAFVVVIYCMSATLHCLRPPVDCRGDLILNSSCHSAGLLYSARVLCCNCCCAAEFPLRQSAALGGAGRMHAQWERRPHACSGSAASVHALWEPRPHAAAALHGS